MPLTKRIIPCLDVKDGRVVKGTRFVSIKDAGDPVELAQRYGDEGADELVFLDITASDERRKAIQKLVMGVASVLDIPFTVGGGVTEMDDARNILLSGADKVGINTGAVNNPGVITDMMDLFGRQCVVVAIDAKRNYDVPPAACDGDGGAGRAGGGGDNNGNNNDNNNSSSAGGHAGAGGHAHGAPGSHARDAVIFEDPGAGENGAPPKKFWFEVRTYGGKKPTGIDAIQWAREAQRFGAGEILLTSIDRDGTKDGYDHILTKAVVDAVSVPVVASGGCGDPSHMAGVFEEAGADAALAASIFHYDRRGVAGVKRTLRDMGIPVRL